MCNAVALTHEWGEIQCDRSGLPMVEYLVRGLHYGISEMRYSGWAHPLHIISQDGGTECSVVVFFIRSGFRFRILFRFSFFFTKMNPPVNQKVKNVPLALAQFSEQRKKLFASNNCCRKYRFSHHQQLLHLGASKKSSSKNS